MATEKNLNNLIINKVENQAVYEQMKIKNLINSDELYFVAGADEVATETTDGLMSAEDKIKLDEIEEGAEANQNAFSNVAIGSNIIAADNTTDTLTLVAGSNVTITPDSANNEITISSKYDKATQSKSGLMSAADKLKLDNIEENANYITVDNNLNETSVNPVQNKIIKQAIDSRAPVSHNHQAADITDLVQVAKTGSYNDLTNKPTIPIKTSQLINDKNYIIQSDIPTQLSSFENDSGFIDNTVDNLINYYTKSNTYSKNEVNNLISTIPTMSIKIVSELPASGNSKFIYLMAASQTEDNNYYNEYLWTGSAYEMIGSTAVNLDGYLKDNGNISNTSANFTTATERTLPQSGEVIQVIFGKIVKYLSDLSSLAFSGSFNDLKDKNGKQLTTNDLTNALKNQYDTAYQYSQEIHAPIDAEKNIIVGVQKNGTDLLINQERKINIEVPTKTSDLTNNSNFVTTTDLNTKVDKVTGKDLSTNDYTTAEKTKLASIETGANKIIVDTALNSTSTNPLQNKVINTKFNDLQSDINSKVPSTRTINGKTLSENITLSASDVGAMPSSTVIPSIEGLATEAYVNNKVAGLVDSAPSTLDTLNELAAALGDDPNFATTVTTQIGNKVDKVNGKQLSTNDFTNEQKTKLEGIASGAEVNIQSDWNETDTTSDAYIKNKPVISELTANEIQDIWNTIFS